MAFSGPLARVSGHGWAKLMSKGTPVSRPSLGGQFKIQNLDLEQIPNSPAAGQLNLGVALNGPADDPDVTIDLSKPVTISVRTEAVGLNTFSIRKRGRDFDIPNLRLTYPNGGGALEGNAHLHLTDNPMASPVKANLVLTDLDLSRAMASVTPNLGIEGKVGAHLSLGGSPSTPRVTPTSSSARSVLRGCA